MKQRKKRWLKVLLMLLLIAIMADMTVRLILLKEEKTPSRCLAIPTQYVLEHPECADKLLQAANINNVHIVQAGTFEPRRFLEMNLSGPNISD